MEKIEGIDRQGGSPMKYLIGVLSLSCYLVILPSIPAQAACMGDTGVCISTPPYTAQGAPSVSTSTYGAAATGLAVGEMLGNLIAPLLAPPPALQNAITEAEKWNIEGNKLFYAATTGKDGNFYLDTEHHCPDALPLLEKSVPYYQRAVIIEPNTEIYRSNLQNTKTAVYACQHGFQFAAHFHHLDILKPRLADRLPMPDLHRRVSVRPEDIEADRAKPGAASASIKNAAARSGKSLPKMG